MYFVMSAVISVSLTLLPFHPETENPLAKICPGLLVLSIEIAVLMSPGGQDSSSEMCPGHTMLNAPHFLISAGWTPSKPEPSFLQ